MKGRIYIDTKKEVLISIRGIQTVDGVSDTTELFTKGHLYRKNGKIYIVYNESEVTGHPDSVTTLKLDGDSRLTLLRNGACPAHLTIARNTRQIGCYGTPYGQLDLGIYASEVRARFDEDGGSLYCKYTLDANPLAAAKPDAAALDADAAFLSVQELFVEVKADVSQNPEGATR